MRPRLATCAVLLLFGCHCGARSKEKAAAPATVIDAREVVEATGTAAPYVQGPIEPAPQQDEREQDRRPVSGSDVPDRGPEPPASPQDDPPIPTTGPFAEEAPPEEREVPADLPPADAGVPLPPDEDPATEHEPGPDPEPVEPSPALEDAGDPLPDPDAHAG